MTHSVTAKRVVFSVINSICYDQRILKMAGTIKSLNCDITIVGRRIGEYCKEEEVPFKTRRFRMLINKGFLFYMFFNIRLLFYLLFHGTDILVSNDLDTLLPNYLVSKLKRIPLVYDSHEYFTGVPELKNRRFVKRVWKSIEKLIFPGLNYAITVSDPIAALYEKEYLVRPQVIRNLSRLSNFIAPFTREELNINPYDLVVIMQGTGINIDKGAEELVNAIAISEGVTLIIAGGGDVIANLKRMVRQLHIEQKVKFVPVSDWETLMKYTRSADCGMCLEKDTNMNYRYSLPNKLFDYISAGIPVIASRLPETGKILEEYECGLIIDSVTPGNIAEAIRSFRNDPGKRNMLRKNALYASSNLNWENESRKVVDLYTEVLNSTKGL